MKLFFFLNINAGVTMQRDEMTADSCGIHAAIINKETYTSLICRRTVLPSRHHSPVLGVSAYDRA